jgi:hypothetical protein
MFMEGYLELHQGFDLKLDRHSMLDLPFKPPKKEK